jgi:hypothetical protein
VAAECNADGTISLEYTADNDGNIIPDYSSVGYHKGDDPLPAPPTTASIAADPSSTDDTARIQSAIDSLSPGGALEFSEGTFRVSSPITIQSSDVTLRGQGSSTTILATSTTENDRDLAVLFIVGATSPSRPVKDSATEVTITDPYVTVGATKITLSDTASFAVGDQVVIERASTEAWISSFGLVNVVLLWPCSSLEIKCRALSLSLLLSLFWCLSLSLPPPPPPLPSPAVAAVFALSFLTDCLAHCSL